MNVIDALLVTLGLDASGMTKGADEAAKAQEKIQADGEKSQKALTASDKKRDAAAATALKKKTAEETAARKRQAAEEAKAGKERDAVAKKAAEGLSKVRNEVLGLLSAYLGLGAIKGFGESLIRTDTQLGRTAGFLDLSVERLNAWQQASSEVGASAEEMSGAIQEANKFQQQLRIGSEASVATLQEYAMAMAGVGAGGMVDASKIMDKNLTTEQRLLELARETAGLSEKDAAYALSKFGISQNVARFLHQGVDEVQRSLTYYAELNKDIQKAADDSRALTTEWVRFKAHIKALGDTFLVDLYPAISKVLGKLMELADWAKDHIPETAVIVGGLTAALLGVSAITFAGIISSIAAVSGGLGVAGTAAAGLLSLLGSIGLVAGAGAVGYAIGTALNAGIDALTKKLTGTNTSFGAYLYDLLHPGELESAPGRSATGKISGASIRPDNRPHFTDNIIPRGIRNNNPGNLNYAGQPGATKETGPGGRFAVFGTMEEGIAALGKQLQLDAKRGLDSVRKIINKYAPPSENDTEAYIKSVTGRMGVGEGAHLDLSNPTTLNAMIKAIIAVENGPKAASLVGPQIDRGLVTGAAAAVTSSQTSNVNNAGAQNNSQVETNINGPININAPQARTNADVGNAIAEKLQSYAFAANANMGLA